MKKTSINFERLLMDFISTKPDDGTIIENLLMNQGIVIKDGEFVRSKKNVKNINIEKTKHHFNPGDVIINVSDIAQIPYRVTGYDRDTILAKNIRTGKSCSFPDTAPLRNWLITNATRGDILVYKNTVFMYKNLAWDFKTNKTKVMYICMATLTEIEYHNNFRFPSEESHIGFVELDKFRFATDDECNFLIEEAKKHGYELTSDHRGFTQSKVKYPAGTWIVDNSGNKTVYKVIDFYKDNYLLMSVDEKIVWKESAYINEQQNIHRWSIGDAKRGDVLHIKKDKTTNYEYLVIFETYLNQFFAKCPVIYCLSTNDFNCLPSNPLSSDNIEPATTNQSKYLFSLMEQKGIDLKDVLQPEKQEADSKHSIETNSQEWNIENANENDIILISGYKHFYNSEPLDWIARIKEINKGILRTSALNKQKGKLFDNISFGITDKNSYDHIRLANADEVLMFYNAQRKNAVSSRQEYNEKILVLIKSFLAENPDIRFNQLIADMNSDASEDVFAEEPKTTFERFKKYIEKAKEQKHHYVNN